VLWIKFLPLKVERRGGQFRTRQWIFVFHKKSGEFF